MSGFLGGLAQKVKRTKTRLKMEKRIALEWFSASAGPEVPALGAEIPVAEVSAKREID